MKLVFLGAPGSGKGTYAEILSKRLNIPHISTGIILREEKTKDTELGRKIRKSSTGKGRLFPDEEMIKIVDKRLKESDCKNGFILDGYPRTIPQADALGAVVEIDFAINFIIDEEDNVKRLLARRTCPKCNRTYNIITSQKPKSDEVCDDCNISLVKREDDTEEVIRNRQEVYKEQTAPLINYYKKKGVLKDIDATGEPEEIIERVMKVI